MRCLAFIERLGARHVGLGQAVARGNNDTLDPRAGRLERQSEPLGAGRRNDRVVRSRQDQRRNAGKFGPRGIGQRRHGAQEDRADQGLRTQQHHRRGDIGAVGIAERDRRGDPIGAARLGDKIGELSGSAAHVDFVEFALTNAPEEARHIPFEHGAAGGEKRGAWRDLFSQRKQIVLVAAGSVKKKERRTSWIDARLEAMDVGQFGRHAGAVIATEPQRGDAAIPRS